MYENGRNIFDYLGNVFIKYLNDPLIFVKALQAIQFFQAREDYPYCMNDLSNAIQPILGVPLYEISFHLKYIDNQDVEWDVRTALDESIQAYKDTKDIDMISENFKSDIRSFCITISNALHRFDYSPEIINGLKQVVIQRVSKNLVNLRMIKNNDIYIDIELTKHTFDSLKNILNNKDYFDANEEITNERSY